jgi:GNAT superfamily N-acetyltransferase
MIPQLLDNPAWSALTTEQAGFAIGTDRAKRYAPGILPFAGFATGGGAADLDPFLEAGASFYCIGQLPALPERWRPELELPCAQLLAPEDGDGLPAVTEAIRQLGPEDKQEMWELINRVQPGYYLPDTYLLGAYFGIRKDGRLVAMAGERMRLTGFNELSAVCTLPGYTGHGYAQQLISHLCRRQMAAGIRPFLHVARANERALRLYGYLGFRHRRDISFWRVRVALAEELQA